MNKIISILMILISVSLPAQPLTLITGRMQSIGGAHAADGKTFSARLYNPAYLASPKNQALFSDTGIGISGLDREFIDFLNNSEYLNLLPVYEGRFFMADLSGPLNSGFIRDNAAFRVYNDINLLSFTPNLAVSSALMLHDELVFQGGKGWNIPLPASWKGNASWGFLAKAFVEWDYLYAEDIVKFFYSFTEPGLFLGNPMNLKTGVGLDLGVQHQLSSVFSYALTLHDAFTPYGDFYYDSVDDYGRTLGYSHSEFGIKPLILSAGMKLSPRVFRRSSWFGPWDFFLDYRDIFAFAYEDPDNPILNLGMGTELTMFGFLDLRAGMNEGLFSVGTAMNFKFWGVGISLYGKELSSEPGVFSVYTAKLNIEFHK